MNRADFTFSHRLRVRWAEVDRQDVVFNGNYFLYFDVAIAEYWRAVGIPYPKGYVDTYQSDIFAVKATAEFHGSATYEDEIDVCCRVSRFGRTSLVFTLGIWKGAEHITSGELVYVNTDLDTRKSAPWPDAFKNTIVNYEHARPAGA